MISIDDLRNIARVKGISNIGYAEKDYILDLVLFSISKNTKNELVFKGGTCLYKFYKINRFSEDIDFSAVKDIDLDALIRKIIIDMSLFGIESAIKEKKEKYNSILLTLHAKGPLYNGKKHSLCNIRIDTNLKSEVNLEPKLEVYSSLYPDISSYSLLIMQEKEILAEKIRAVTNRNYARDVYDLWFLLEKGIRPDRNIIEKKLAYYKRAWNYKEFILRVNDKRDSWEREIGPLIIGNIPDFNDVEEVITKKIKNI